jgi:hypothetical protein
MAAVRAVTMAATIHHTLDQVKGDVCVASNAPVNANGKAKTVWLNLMNDA